MRCRCSPRHRRLARPVIPDLIREPWIAGQARNDSLQRLVRGLEADQAIETAMKASKNINTAPASGKTSGMDDTTASTGSISGDRAWDVGLDMVIP